MSATNEEAPSRIWLQWNGDQEPQEGEPSEVTWCGSQIFPHDVEYLRATPAQPTPPAGPDAELVAYKARLDVLERLGTEGRFPDWDDNGFWFSKIKGEYVSGTTLRQFCDAALARYEPSATERQPSGEGK